MINIYYARFDKIISPCRWDRYFGLLPPDQQDRNKLYRRWEDKNAHLLGRVLLYYSLIEEGCRQNPLYEIRYTAYSRPFINQNIDFNISHAGYYVVCALGRDCKLGIDIEKYDQVEFELLQNTMNEKQWEAIKRSFSPGKAFYRYWTVKESVIKADGRGLSLPIADIDIHDDVAICEEKKWHLTSFHFDQFHVGCLATNSARRAINYRQFHF